MENPLVRICSGPGLYLSGLNYCCDVDSIGGVTREGLLITGCDTREKRDRIECRGLDGTRMYTFSPQKRDEKISQTK